MIHRTPSSRYLAFKGFAFALSLAMLTSCSIPVDQQGNIPKPSALAQIKPGVSNKQTVTRLLGSPSSVASFNGNTWYYIGRDILNQQVVAIHFNKSGVVTGVEHKDLQDAEAVTPNPNSTPSEGRQFTFLEQLIGNFGKFNNTKTNNTPGGPNTGGP
jgi:outer membrane protein assembly factor BamE (lipoprotein component of BamABCDE complex)